MAQETETLEIKNETLELTRYNISHLDYSRSWFEIGINTTIIEEESKAFVSLHYNYLNPRKNFFFINAASNNFGFSYGQFLVKKDIQRTKLTAVIKEYSGSMYTSSGSAPITFHNNFVADVNIQVSYSLGLRAGYNYSAPQTSMWQRTDSRVFQKFHFGLAFAKTFAYKYHALIKKKSLESNRNVFRTTQVFLEYMIQEELFKKNDAIPEVTIFHGPRFELRFRYLGNNPRKHGWWLSLGTSASVNEPLWQVFGGVGKAISAKF